MESKSPSVCAFVKVENELKSAIGILANHERQKNEQLVKCETRVADLTKTLAQETENTHKNQIKLQAVEEKYAQQTIEWNGKIELLEFEIEEIKVNETRKIDVLKKEIERRGLIIEQINQEKKIAIHFDETHGEKLEEKNKTIKQLKKRIKSFDEEMSKQQEEYAMSLKKEKDIRHSLRRQLKKMKAGASDEDVCVKEASEMKRQIVEHATRIQKLNTERFEWEKERSNYEKDAEILLIDYTEKCHMLDILKANEIKLKEKIKSQSMRMREMDAALAKQEERYETDTKALKELYEALETKYRKNFVEKRQEYISIHKRVKQAESDRNTMEEHVKMVDAKYNNMLKFNKCAQLMATRNASLIVRIDQLEEWFDEAWAGFRLEVLCYERKLEAKDEVIAQLKYGKPFQRVKPRFEET